jgi:hypothetical protein
VEASADAVVAGAVVADAVLGDVVVAGAVAGNAAAGDAVVAGSAAGEAVVGDLGQDYSLPGYSLQDCSFQEYQWYHYFQEYHRRILLDLERSLRPATSVLLARLVLALA